MNTNTDLIRSHVDTIIMRTLEIEDRYGYEILDIIGSLSNNKYVIKQPTLYSCLKRLEKQGFISSYEGSETNGRQRRYYKLEEKGFDTLAQDKIEWEFSRSIIDKLLSDRKVDLEEIEPPFDASNLRPLTKRIKAYDVLENGGLNYDENQELLDDEYEEDSVSLALFSECKNQLREATEKIRSYEKLLSDHPIDGKNQTSTIESFYIEDLKNKLMLAEQKNEDLEVLLSEKNKENIDFNKNDNFDNLTKELIEAQSIIENLTKQNAVLSENFIKDEDSQAAIEYLQNNIEELGKDISALHNILGDKNREIEYLSKKLLEINEENEKNYLNRRSVSSNILFAKDNDVQKIENDIIEDNAKDKAEKNLNITYENKADTITSEIEKSDTKEDKSNIDTADKLNAKRLLSIGEFAPQVTAYMDDVNNRIDYQEAAVADNMAAYDGYQDNYEEECEREFNNKKSYKYNEDVDGEYLVEKTQNTVKNKKNYTVQNSPIVNLKNEMIKSGYKVKTFAKDSTGEYYCKNYIYANKMAAFVALSLFMINVIEILVFGIAKSFFNINTVGLIIITALAVVPPIGIIINSIINSSKIIKKNTNYIKTIAFKMLYFTLLAAIITLLFAVVPQLKEYFGKGIMFVPIILLLNLPLSELFRYAAEKSNKYNVNY